MSNLAACWFYAVGAEQLGPVSVEQLYQLTAGGQVRWDTLVWREGMAQWERLVDVPELAQLVRAAAPSTEQVVPLQYHIPPQELVQYGGFWLRFAAAIVDGLLIGVPSFLLFSAIRLAAGVPVFDDSVRTTAAVLIEVADTLFGLVVGWLYEALMTSSAKQATIGKQICGLKVVGSSGERISFGRATGRHFAKILSTIILFIGYMLAGWTQRKQALHDMLADTFVVYKQG